MPPKPPKHKQKSFIKQTLETKKSIGETDFGNFKVSLQYFDSSQEFSQSFAEWESKGILSQAMEVLKGYCDKTLQSQIGGKFTIYGDFPPKEKTKFTHPVHVPEDANWARMHINGKNVIAGHVNKDTFYIVFLDGEHKFYMTKKETGK